jgi:hypothetical protein
MPFGFAGRQNRSLPAADSELGACYDGEYLEVGKRLETGVRLRARRTDVPTCVYLPDGRRSARWNCDSRRHTSLDPMPRPE